MSKIIIIDDESSGVNILKLMIERLQMNLNIVATTTSSEKGIELVNFHKPDILFLDVQMPKYSGFELLEKINFKDFKLVFTTAHPQHAIKAIKLRAFDYLLKPIDKVELKTCIEHILDSEPKTINQSLRNVLEIAVSDGILMIKKDLIIRLEAEGSYTFLYMKDGSRHAVSKNIKQFENILDPRSFYRCHNSHIINLNEITKFIISDGYYTLMSNGEKVNVTRKSKDDLIVRLKTL